MKVIEILKNPILKSKRFPLFKVVDIINKSKTDLNDKEMTAIRGLTISSTIFAAENDDKSKMEALIQFSEYLETFADTDEYLSDIQLALSNLVAIKII